MSTTLQSARPAAPREEREGEPQSLAERRPLVMWQARHDNGWRTVLLEQPDGAFVAYAGIRRTVILHREDSLERARDAALAALEQETGHGTCSPGCSEWAISVKWSGPTVEAE